MGKKGKYLHPPRKFKIYHMTVVLLICIATHSGKLLKGKNGGWFGVLVIFK